MKRGTVLSAFFRLILLVFVSSGRARHDYTPIENRCTIAIKRDELNLHPQ